MANFISDSKKIQEETIRKTGLPLFSRLLHPRTSFPEERTAKNNARKGLEIPSKTKKETEKEKDVFRSAILPLQLSHFLTLFPIGKSFRFLFSGLCSIVSCCSLGWAKQTNDSTQIDDRSMMDSFIRLPSIDDRFNTGAHYIQTDDVVNLQIDNTYCLVCVQTSKAD